MEKEKGLLHIYTGDGKGKTTAALGLAVRAAGNKKRVLLTQFMKGQPTGELISLEKLGITIVRTDEVKTFVAFMSEDEKKSCENAHKMCYTKTIRLLKEEHYDMVILDEVMAAIQCNMLSLAEVLNFIKQKPVHTELILTGRDAPKELIEIADYVSEIANVKHPYSQGINARKGIEY